MHGFEVVVLLILIIPAILFVGVPVGVMRIISYAEGYDYIAYVILTALLIFVGILKRKSRYGKVGLIIGLILWEFLGLAGLGMYF
jgi:hypothetical protein